MRKRSAKEYLELLLFITVITAAGSVLHNWYVENCWKQVGSFEYIRRGEGLLQDGRFRESIKYFEMAYAASPENNIIILELINAYTRYAVQLAESGKYGRAIKCLERAHDVKPDSRTMQSLAIVYSKKGVSEMRDNPVSARCDFKNAREAAAPSVTASDALSISLYNDAVTEYRAGRDGPAIMLLEESALAHKGNPAFELLGDIYYKKTGFEKARFYYGKALAFGPRDKTTRGKLRKAMEGLDLAKRQGSKSFAHFELRHDKALTADIDLIERLLERCYSDIGNDLKYFPDSKTIVFLYSPGDFKRIFKPSSGLMAFYDGNIRIPLPEGALDEKKFSDHIRHEYTHAVVSAKTDNNCPVWLSEGLAMWEEYKNNDAYISAVFGDVVDKKQLTLKSLYGGFSLTDGLDASAADEKERTANYLASYSVVKYIIDGWGCDGLRNLLARIRDGRHFINAIDDEFLLSEKEFEKRWKDYVVKKYLKKER